MHSFCWGGAGDSEWPWSEYASLCCELGLSMLHSAKPQLDCPHADLRFTCWMGAYPGLTEHFAKANLDPKANQWDKVTLPSALGQQLCST